MSSDFVSPRVVSPSIYSVSFEDLVDIWIESMHPEDNILIVWDAKTHLDILKKSGFLLEEGSMYNNKILTISTDDVRDCFYIMDVLSAYDTHPYLQIYSGGKLLTDNLENLRDEITI
jgi:hypothetical protein|tara:strand:- start:2964 stop:3314 length:351 start_codon:yes stop_codon:yes gene_type:complete